MREQISLPDHPQLIRELRENLKVAFPSLSAKQAVVD
jgi:hypothetical protein